MIRFKTKPETVRVTGDDKCFDNTELGSYTRKERKAVSFSLFPLTRSVLTEIRDDVSERRMVTKIVEGQRISEPEDYVDNTKFSEEALIRIVRGWDGILDENGKPLEFSVENLLDIASAYPLLASAWLAVCRLLMSEHEKYIDKKVKNSSSSQDGSGKEEKT